MDRKIVYAHLAGRKIKFDFRPARNASIAGQYELWGEDWIYIPSPGLGYQPTDKWIYEHEPRGK